MRVGIFGGTFDPIHIGHLIIANELRYALQLDEVRFVPAGDPPHKPDQRITRGADRVLMVEFAIAGHAGFLLDRIEVDRIGPSFTKDTLAALKAREPACDFVFLMGADSLRDLPTWNEPERILTLAEIGVAARPDVTVDLEALSAALPRISDRVRVVDVPLIDIASREIRLRCEQGRPITFLVPPAVEQFIEERGLYRSP